MYMDEGFKNDFKLYGSMAPSYGQDWHVSRLYVTIKL